MRRARTRTNYASSLEAKEGQSDREQPVEEEAGGEMDEVQRKSGARNREPPAPTSVFDLSLLPKQWCMRQRQRKHDQALSGKKRNFGGKAKISIAAERTVNVQVSHTGNTPKQLGTTKERTQTFLKETVRERTCPSTVERISKENAQSFLEDLWSVQSHEKKGQGGDKDKPNDAQLERRGTRPRETLVGQVARA